LKFQRRDQNAPEIEKENIETAENKPKKGKYSVSLYVTILFVVVLILILLSHFIQQRNNSETISDITQQHKEFSAQALQNIEDLQSRNLQLAEENKQLEDEIAELDEKIDELEAAAEAAEQEKQVMKDEKALVAKLMSLQLAVDNGDVNKAKEIETELTAEKTSLSAEYLAKFQRLQAEIQKLNTKAE